MFFNYLIQRRGAKGRLSCCSFWVLVCFNERISVKNQARYKGLKRTEKKESLDDLCWLNSRTLVISGNNYSNIIPKWKREKRPVKRKIVKCKSWNIVSSNTGCEGATLLSHQETLETPASHPNKNVRKLEHIPATSTHPAICRANCFIYLYSARDTSKKKKNPSREVIHSRFLFFQTL